MKICSPMKWLKLTLRSWLFCNFFSYVIAYQIIVIAQL